MDLRIAGFLSFRFVRAEIHGADSPADTVVFLYIRINAIINRLRKFLGNTAQRQLCRSTGRMVFGEIAGRELRWRPRVDRT